MKNHSKIAIVIGTKAELIKCMPLMVELQKQKKDYWFIHTGQHPLGKACDEFGVKKPDFILSEEPEISTKFWSKINKISLFWFSSMIFKIKDSLRKINPKYVVYHGDTMSTAAAAIGSSKFFNDDKKWKNVHLEAGLRSGSILEPFPEEISRQISDKFSDILLAVSDRTEKNLENARKKNKQVLKMGNTIVDSAHIIKSQSGKPLRTGKYALINLHRHENLNAKKRMENIINILGGIGIKAIWPLHDNTEYYLKKYGLYEKVKRMKHIEIMPLVDYKNFINLLANCQYLITDGGSIQEESLVFKKPCVLLRKKTERQEGLDTGINFLTGLDVKKSKEVIASIENGDVKIEKILNPYGKKGLTKKILEVLK